MVMSSPGTEQRGQSRNHRPALLRRVVFQTRLGLIGVSLVAIALGVLILVAARLDPATAAGPTPAVTASHTEHPADRVIQGLPHEDHAAIATRAASLPPYDGRITTISSISVDATPSPAR
jgi:hypothetical protein